MTLNLEEMTLDSIEIQAIPPLPLWLLLEADKEKQQMQHTTKDTKEDVRNTFLYVTSELNVACVVYAE